MEEKVYLGDSVYVKPWNDGVVITTENGGAFDPSNEVYMEAEVLKGLIKFLRRHTPDLLK